MLHIELFRGTLQGGLSRAQGTHTPFDQRDDVFDGTRILDDAKRSVTYWAPSANWHYETDAEGRKLVGRMDLRDV